VTIRASSSKQIDTLIANLISGTAVTREGAIARLTVFGARAVERLIVLADSDALSPARIAAFRTLEAIADPRALDAALRAIDSPDLLVASAALAVARAFIRSSRGASVVDALTTVALDSERPDVLRVAALGALLDLERSTIAPLLRTLAADPSAPVRHEIELHTGTRVRQKRVDPAETLSGAAQELPDDPGVLQAGIVAGGETVDLPLLLSIIERVRDREAKEPPGRRMEWTTARAAAHAALARRGSRIALYDLRESLETAESPLPVEFLAALSAAGDASCLEAIAGAYHRAAATAGSDHDWWRRHLADAFKTIVRREKITRRHAVAKKIEKRWPREFKDLWAGKAGWAAPPARPA
jgi:HEAT repeat protein